MPKARVGYGTEITQLGMLLKRVDKSLPTAWQLSVKERAQDLIKLLAAADHDPSAHHAAENPARKPVKKNAA